MRRFFVFSRVWRRGGQVRVEEDDVGWSQVVEPEYITCSTL